MTSCVKTIHGSQPCKGRRRKVPGHWLISWYEIMSKLWVVQFLCLIYCWIVDWNNKCYEAAMEANHPHLARCFRKWATYYWYRLRKMTRMMMAIRFLGHPYWELYGYCRGAEKWLLLFLVVLRKWAHNYGARLRKTTCKIRNHLFLRQPTLSGWYYEHGLNDRGTKLKIWCICYSSAVTRARAIYKYIHLHCICPFNLCRRVIYITHRQRKVACWFCCCYGSCISCHLCCQ